MTVANNFFSRFIQKKADRANNSARILLNRTPDINEDVRTLDIASELNTGKLGKLMTYMSTNKKCTVVELKSVPL